MTMLVLAATVTAAHDFARGRGVERRDVRAVSFPSDIRGRPARSTLYVVDGAWGRRHAADVLDAARKGGLTIVEAAA